MPAGGDEACFAVLAAKSAVAAVILRRRDEVDHETGRRKDGNGYAQVFDREWSAVISHRGASKSLL